VTVRASNLVKLSLLTIGWVALAWFVAFMLAKINSADARDNGQWGNVDPSIREWIESLRNKNNVGCCDTADGYDAQWDTLGPDGTYRVFINGQWHVVPPEALLTVPNRLGVPKVWWVPGGDTGVIIRCFLPGAGA
jgi:hypothetical protein